MILDSSADVLCSTACKFGWDAIALETSSSAFNHNLAYCYNDARVIRWLWQQAKRGFRGGARSFE
jgi:hypothetical protein